MILSDSYILFLDFDLSSTICSPIFNWSSYISFDFTSLISYFVWAWSNSFLLISHWRICCWFITNRHTHLYVITLIFTEYLPRNFTPSAHFTNFSAPFLKIHLCISKLSTYKSGSFWPFIFFNNLIVFTLLFILYSINVIL